MLAWNEHHILTELINNEEAHGIPTKVRCREAQQNPLRCPGRDHQEWAMVVEVPLPSDENCSLFDKFGSVAHYSYTSLHV